MSRKSNLLVISNLFYPDHCGGASIFSELCFALAKADFNVNVFTSFPYYPEWRNKQDSSILRIHRETIHSVNIWRHAIYIPKSPSYLLPRIFYEFSFFISLLRSLGRGPRMDIIMVFCPMIGGLFFAAFRKLFRRELIWLNIQDIPADAARSSGISRFKIIDLLSRTIQSYTFNKADIWSTISPVMLHKLSELRNFNQPLHLCPNWLHESLAKHIEKLPEKIHRPPHSPLRLLYCGNIGKKQGLVDFCRILSLTDINFKLAIHGEGSESQAVKDFIHNQSDSRFSFGPFFSEAELALALYDSDLFLITEKPGSGASFIPSRLIPSITTGTPLLAICDGSGPLGKEVNEFELGIQLEWSSLSKLDESISMIYNNSNLFSYFMQKCIQHSKYYNRHAAIEHLTKLIRNAIDKQGNYKYK